jgi:NAD(P)-dependent dehydrogenase (short-subunit alcohol dehydrogenase family)
MNSQKSVLITGASGLIGSALVSKFESSGWRVMAHSYASAIQSNVEELRSDLSEPESGKKLLDSVEKIDCVINNAAKQEVKEIEELTPEYLAKLFQINVLTPLEIMAAAHAKGASLAINISSVEGITSRPGHEAYGATKAALDSLTKSLAISLAPMRVNGLRLGLIGDENLQFRWPSGVASWNSLVPTKRYGSPLEVAEFVHELTSDTFRFTTGAIFDFDGGKSATPGW